MRNAGLMLLVIVMVLLIVGTTIRVGATHQDVPPMPDLRTFVWVREPLTNIVGADVVFVRMKDHERWIFPKTGPGGWTKRQVPDGKYLVTIKADGYVTKILYLTVPPGDAFYKTFKVLLARAAR